MPDAPGLRDGAVMILDALRGRLIVSCQPVPGGPLDQPATVAAHARAALVEGAAGLRIEGVANLRAVRGVSDAPVIGLIKRDLEGSGVRITPWEEDVDALHVHLLELMQSEERRRELGQRGRQRVLDKFTQAQVAAQTVAIYRDMAQSQAVL